MDDGEYGDEDQCGRDDEKCDGDQGEGRFLFGVFGFIFFAAEEDIQQEQFQRKFIWGGLFCFL